MSGVSTVSTSQLSRTNRLGLGLAFLLGLTHLPMVLRGGPDPGQVGPPLAVVITESICGLIIIVAVIVAWRRQSALAIRVAAGALIVSVLIALPAFFVDSPALNKLALAIVLGLTLAAVMMMLTPDRAGAVGSQA